MTDIENGAKILNKHVENIITVKLSKMSLINMLEKMRLNYQAKLEVINLKIKKLENKLLNDITNEFKDAVPVKLNKRGRPRKIYPTIMPEVIHDPVVEAYEVVVVPFSSSPDVQI